MILRSIEVKGWRCFASSVRLGRLNERLNVVHGPNGAGKSTLFQAMARGLLDNYRVGGEEAEALRPWGRLVAPVVTIEFCHQGQEYRLTKQFLDRPSATLERMERGSYMSLSEGESADNQVRQMLHATAPGRGLAQVKNWGVAQVLWTLQGDLDLRELSGDVSADIRSMLGAQFAGRGGGRLEPRIDALYSQFFKKSGAAKKGQNAPEAVRLEELLIAARNRLAEARGRLELFETRSLRLEGVRAEKAQLWREIEACNKALVEARQRAQKYTELSIERARRAGDARATEAEYRQIAQQIETIRDSATELARATEERKRLEDALPAMRRAEAESRAEAQRRKTVLEDARGKQALVDAARSDAMRAESFTAARLQASELSLKLEQVRDVLRKLAAVQSERSRLAAPGAAALRSIRKAAKARDEAQLQLQAALIHIEIEPSRDAAVIVLEGDKPGAVSLRVGRAETFHGSPAVVLDIDGIGRLRASGPASDAGELRAQQGKADAKLVRLTEPFGTADIEALEKLSDQAAELDGLIAGHEAKLEGLLAGKTADLLVAELSKCQKIVAETEAQRLEWKDNPPDAAALGQAAVGLERQVREEVAAAERRWTDAGNIASSAETKAAEEAGRLQQSQKHAEGLEGRLQSLRADGKTDTDRERERSHAALLWDAARAKLEEIEFQLAGYAGDPSTEVKRLEMQLAALEKQERKTLEREKLEEGGLSETAAQGPYGAFAAAEEEVAALTPRLAREQLRMRGVELLWKTVRECRASAVAAVAAPVETAATTMLHRIAGGRLGRIRLGEGLTPMNLEVGETDAPVMLDDASGGEREQIFLTTRLALAEVLAREERQLVLLDDVLTATDTARMARIMYLLEESADTTQIVILTCHPERYLALDGAEFFDVEHITADCIVAAR
jgi:uncharacterized protein YhaN